MLTRRIARPLLASIFVTGGIDSLRNPGPRVKRSEPVTSRLSETLPLPDDPEQLVKLNAALHVGFGMLLAFNKLPRLSAAVLAVTLVPTTLGGHRFWEDDDPQMRKNQQIHFLKNLGILGGLIIAATDTEGAPSLGWRARRAAKKAKKAAKEARKKASEVLPVG
jgi:putative oxidoreductase